MDSGADVSVLRQSLCIPNIQFNKDNIISLNSFTSNQVKTLGTLDCMVYIHGRQYELRFHIVPDSVRINNCDAILGNDFCYDHNIILDWKTLQMISGNDAKVVFTTSIKSILKNPIQKKFSNKSNKTTRTAVSQQYSIPVSNKYECLDVKNEDITYGTDTDISDFVKSNFE